MEYPAAHLVLRTNLSHFVCPLEDSSHIDALVNIGIDFEDFVETCVGHHQVYQLMYNVNPREGEKGIEEYLKD